MMPGSSTRAFDRSTRRQSSTPGESSGEHRPKGCRIGPDTGCRAQTEQTDPGSRGKGKDSAQTDSGFIEIVVPPG